MKDSPWFNWKFMFVAFLGIWAYFIASTIYTVFTGNVWFTNIHYSIGGRIFCAIFGIGFSAFWLWFVRDLWREHKKDKENA